MDFSDEAVTKLLVDFCLEVSSPFSLRVADLIVRDPIQLKSLRLDTRDYSSPEDFANDYLALNFLKKFKGLKGITKQDRRNAALAGWSACEHRNFRTNQRIIALLCGDCNLIDQPLGEIDGNQTTLAKVITIAQEKISRVLGPFNWKKATSECRWSSGATFDHPRGTPLSKKMTENVTVTKRALPHLRKVMSRDLHWMEALCANGANRECWGPASPLEYVFNVVETNRFIVVPKTAFVDRPIAAEPTGNAFLQQGFGRYLRHRLKRFGVDLDDQSWNKHLAGLAGKLGLSTLDLESASDSLARMLIKLLLPARWFSYLEDLRSPYSQLKTGKNIKRVHLEKFSSMGNAFTFELESLIFWALSSAVMESKGIGDSICLGIYGDDIVIPRSCYETLVDVLNWCGFVVNSAKSFKDGPFFESCGGHYFLGKDVTAFNQEESLSSLHEKIALHNRMIRWSIRVHGTPFSRFTKKLCQRLNDGKHLIPFGDLGDDGFLSAKSDLGTFCPNRGFKCRVTTFVPDREVLYKQRGFYAYKLRRRHYSNADPKGRPLGDIHGSGRWVSTERWIHSVR